jgi:hypothetical protein
MGALVSTGGAWLMRKLIILVILLAGCGPKGPHWRKYCAEMQTVTSVGISITTGSPVVAFTNICMRYDSTWISNEE